MPATVNIGTLEGLLRWKADDAELNKSLDTVAKKADVSRSQLGKYNKELGTIDAAYKRVAASLDPTIARTQKYDASVEALDKALKSSLITQAQHTALLSKAQTQLQSTTHWTQRLGLEIGSNLKSQFLGTIGVAAVLGTTLTAVSSVTRQLATATIEAEASQRRAQEAARRYGDVSGITAKRIDEIAQSLSKLSGLDDELISDAEVIGAKFNRISSEIFPRFSKAALDLSVATGLDLPAAFEKAGKIVNQPLKGLTLLSREGYAVSKSQSDMVKSFVASGDIMAAQGVMLEILESQYEGAAEAARDSLGGAITALGTTWENFLEKVGEDSSGPIRDAIENLISFLELLTDSVDDLSLAWNQSLAVFNLVLASMRRGIAELIDLIPQPVITIATGGLSGLLGNSPAARLRANAIRDEAAAAERSAAVARLLTANFAELSIGRRKDTDRTLEQTAAESKLGDEQRKAISTIDNYIAALIRQAEESAAYYHAYISGGEEAVELAKVEQKVINTIFSQRETLNKLDIKSREESIRQIRQAIELEYGFKKAKDDTTDAVKSFVSAMVQSAKATSDWATEGQKHIDLINEQRAEVDKTIASIAREIELIKSTSSLKGLDLERALNLQGVEDGIDSVISSIQRLEGETDEAFRVRLRTATEDARAALLDLANTEWKANLQASLEEPFLNAWDNIQSSFTDTMNDMILEGSADWDSFWDGFKRAALEAIEQWLIRWIKAQRLAQAEAARTKAANIAASSGGGLTQGAGGVTGLTGSATSIGMTGGTAATGGFNWAAAGSAIGWAAVAAIWMKVLGGLYEGFTKGKLKFGEASFEGGASGTGKLSRQIAEVIDKIVKDVNGTLDAWNIGVDKLANISIRVTEKGEFTVRSIIDPVGKMFRSMEEAVEYAKTQAIKLAEFSESTSKLIVAAIRGSKAEDTGGLFSDIDFARMLESQNLPDIANQMQAMLQTAVNNFHRAMELFAGDLTQMEVAIGSILTNLTTNVQALYNNLMGIKEDPKEVWRRQRDAYNLQRAIMIAQLTLLYEEIKARILLFQTQQLTLQGFERGTIDRPPGRGGQLEEGGHGLATKGGMNPNQPPPDNRNPGNNPFLQNLLNILDNLGRAMLNLPPEITGDMPRGFGGGRGGGGGNRESARDFLEDRRFQSSLLGLSEVERAIKQLNREYEEQLKNAGKDSKLRADLIKQREEETARIREDNKKDVAARYDELIGNTDAFDQVSKQFEDMGKEVKDAGFGARRTARMLGELTAAEEKAVRVLSMQKYADLVGGLAQYIDDAVLKQELLAAQAQIKFTLEMEAFRVEFELLKEKGKLTQAQIDAVERAFDYIDNNMPDFNGGGLPGGGEGPDLSGMIWTGQGWIPAPANDNVNPLQNAQDLLQRYIDAGRDAYQLDLERLNDDFDIIRAALGDTAQVTEEYANAIDRLNDQYLSSLQDVYDQLSGGELGGFGLEEQTAQAEEQYLALLARVQAGDLGQADALAAAAERWIELYGQTYGSSTAAGGFAGIRDQVRDALAGILGLSPSSMGMSGGLSNLIGGPERFNTGLNGPSGGIIVDLGARDERTFTATNRVADTVISQSTLERNLLTEIRNLLTEIRNGTNGSASASNSSLSSGISYGDNDSRGKPFLPIKKVS